MFPKAKGLLFFDKCFFSKKLYSQRAKDISVCLLALINMSLGKGEEVRGLVIRDKKKRGLDQKSLSGKHQRLV